MLKSFLDNLTSSAFLFAFVAYLGSGVFPVYAGTNIVPLDSALPLLTKIAAHLPDYKFRHLKVGNTTPDAWRVEDKHGEALAVIKCTSGNTNAEGEFMTYKLAQYLNFPIYPVTILLPIREPLAKRLGTKPQVCALKAWVHNWSTIYWKAQRNLTKIVEEGKYAAYKKSNTFLSGTGFARELADTIMCENKLQNIQQRKIVLDSIKPTKNGDPLVGNESTFFKSTPTNLISAAKDMSNLMLMDAIVGNGDRFPGLNFEFRSQANMSRSVGKASVELYLPRLMSLDNGLTFKGWSNSWGMQEMRYYLRRFDPEMIEKLKLLYQKLNNFSPQQLKQEFPYLMYPTQINKKINGVEYIKHNLRQVLQFIQEVKHGTQKEYIPGKKQVCQQLWL